MCDENWNFSLKIRHSNCAFFALKKLMNITEGTGSNLHIFSRKRIESEKLSRFPEDQHHPNWSREVEKLLQHSSLSSETLSVLKLRIPNIEESSLVTAKTFQLRKQYSHKHQQKFSELQMMTTKYLMLNAHIARRHLVSNLQIFLISSLYSQLLNVFMWYT